MKRKGWLALGLAAVLLLAGCASGLADCFAQEDVTNRAKEVVETINTLDYQAVVDELREDLRDQITPQRLEESWGTQLTAAGAFQEYKSVTLVGQKDKTTGEDYATAVLVCRYENASLTYTLTFDRDLALVGLYMK